MDEYRFERCVNRPSQRCHLERPQSVRTGVATSGTHLLVAVSIVCTTPVVAYEYTMAAQSYLPDTEISRDRIRRPPEAFPG